ncbi:hypothetical protein [Nonomuraea africana]|uniref:Uncharacterized protein n=1 Tax=Nonomuraea africana TaxID=46171 RepID=A0ABR9KC89_9ACTN|nr:hypothetical protein [Nonomuraea africana]MBE1559622.1 hypothetical protein [Nonomuraea africana]
MHRAFTTVGLAGSLTIGLQRDAHEAECPHYNVLTDAEWARLSIDLGAHERNSQATRARTLSLAQSFADRDTWLRWADRGVRELVDLPPCLAEDGPVDDPERCLLFEGHPGKHSFDPSRSTLRIMSPAAVRHEALFYPDGGGRPSISPPS